MRLGVAVTPPRLANRSPLGAAGGGRRLRLHVRRHAAGTLRRAAATRSPRPTKQALRGIHDAAAHRSASGARGSAALRSGASGALEAAAGDAAAARCATCRPPRSACSSRPPRTTARSGTTSAASRSMSRMTTAEGVLEAIYALAGIAPPAEDDEGRVPRASARGAAQGRGARCSMASGRGWSSPAHSWCEGDFNEAMDDARADGCRAGGAMAPLCAADIKVDLEKETGRQAAGRVRADGRHLGRGAGRRATR